LKPQCDKKKAEDNIIANDTVTHMVRERKKRMKKVVLASFRGQNELYN
jgi:hypothetical protein